MKAQLDAVGDDMLRLSGTVDYASVPELLQQSRPYFQDRQRLLVDWSRVKGVNSGALGLILEWLDWSRTTGMQLTHKQMPLALRRLSALSNLQTLIEDIDPAQEASIG